MTHFKSNLRDIEFNLFELFGRQDLLGSGLFGEVDEETARGMLDEVNRLATGPLAESFVAADRTPPEFDPVSHSVRMPESFRKSFQTFVDAEWFRLELPAELGGTVVPRSLVWAIAELVLGANPAIWMYSSGAAFSRALYEMGTPEQQRFAQHAVDRRWTATMVLTEADAGSDVGSGRTKAIQQPDGTWHIEGVKRFITSGEHDMAENIFHLVLARPEGAGPGTKGLSMFLVPKYLVNEDGSLGERNGVYATKVEHKMGLKVSTTCELTFGADQPAIGTLVGDAHDGIRQMFMIIEHARMLVGTKAIATLSTGYLNALEYAKTRIQGGELATMSDKTAPRVTIMHHPDVRRSLMMQKAYAEGMRALVMFTATFQDAAQLARAEGAPDAAAAAMNDLLLPLVKGLGSERAYEQLTQSLQTFGGHGYLQDYPIEQYIRDAKIDSLYEGTTAIQGMDLYFRKIVRNQGEALALAAQQHPPDRRGRAGQRPAQAGTGRPRPCLRRRRGDGDADARLPGRQPGAARGDQPGRAEHHQAAALARRPGRRLAAGPPGRGRARRARRGNVERRGRGVLPGQDRGGALLRRGSTAAPGRGAGNRRDHLD